MRITKEVIEKKLQSLLRREYPKSQKWRLDETSRGEYRLIDTHDKLPFGYLAWKGKSFYDFLDCLYDHYSALEMEALRNEDR